MYNIYNVKILVEYEQQNNNIIIHYIKIIVYTLT